MARRIVVAAGVVLLAGCSAQPPPQEAPQVQMPDRAAAADLGVAGTGFGDPLPGLGAVELGRFDVGKTEFTAPEEPDEGLGPVFNEAACVSCHLGPGTAVGGTTGRRETRFGSNASGTFDPLANLGGSLIQDQGIGLVHVNGDFTFVGEAVPAAANVISRRITTQLFGLGLVDAVP